MSYWVATTVTGGIILELTIKYKSWLFRALRPTYRDHNIIVSANPAIEMNNDVNTTGNKQLSMKVGTYTKLQQKSEKPVRLICHKAGTFLRTHVTVYIKRMKNSQNSNISRLRIAILDK